jgi:hypothetical protein
MYRIKEKTPLPKQGKDMSCGGKVWKSKAIR